MANRSLHEIKSELLTALREEAELADKAGAPSLQARLEGDRIPRLKEERAVLVGLGEFNHGKTTFVNALLGGPVLPTGITPTTAVIHEVRHGEDARATVVRRGEEVQVDGRSRIVGASSEEIPFGETIPGMESNE